MDTQGTAVGSGWTQGVQQQCAPQHTSNAFLYEVNINNKPDIRRYKVYVDLQSAKCVSADYFFK